MAMEGSPGGPTDYSHYGGGPLSWLQNKKKTSTLPYSQPKIELSIHTIIIQNAALGILPKGANVKVKSQIIYMKSYRFSSKYYYICYKANE